MRIASTFLQLNSNKNGENGEEGKETSLPTTSNGQNENAVISVGKVDRLRLGAQSAMNHLIYGKWRKSMGRMPKLEGIIGGNEEEETRIWILGREYPICREQAEEAEEEGEDGTIWKVGDEFLEDFRSQIWFTYRERFAPLEGNEKIGNSLGTITTTDCGWGCTLRAAQMLLAQTFLRIKLGREFRLQNCSASDFQKYISIIRLFEDCPISPFGLHSLLKMAGRREWEPAIGRWYSPSQAALLLKDALAVGLDSEEGKKLDEELCIWVCADNCVVLGELRECSRQFMVPLLLVIPLRLGTENVNEIYYGHLQLLHSLHSFVGIIGGRPRNAVYLVGCIEKVFLTLDPHTVQSYRKLDEKEKGDKEENAKKWASFRCDFPSTIPIENLDPSCALGFLIQNEEELNEWMGTMGKNGMAEVHVGNAEEMMNRQPNALFTVMEEKQNFEETLKNLNKKKKVGRRKKSEKEGKSPNGSVEFEIL